MATLTLFEWVLRVSNRCSQPLLHHPNQTSLQGQKCLNEPCERESVALQTMKKSQDRLNFHRARYIKRKLVSSQIALCDTLMETLRSLRVFHHYRQRLLLPPLDRLIHLLTVALPVHSAIALFEWLVRVGVSKESRHHSCTHRTLQFTSIQWKNRPRPSNPNQASLTKCLPKRLLKRQE